MSRVWNIGNTTVRNPKRIQEALRLFVSEGFQGNAKGEEQELRLHRVFIKNGIVDSENEDPATGRKWRSAFDQLGFISRDRLKIAGKPYPPDVLFPEIGLKTEAGAFSLTPAGRKLIASESVPEIQEIFCRQLCAYELPSPLEGKFGPGTMKPFLVVLAVLTELYKAGDPGISKEEIGLFLQIFRPQTEALAPTLAQEILTYRAAVNACPDGKSRKDLKQEKRLEIGEKFGLKPETPISYADATMRYFSLSGLLIRRGERLEIRESRKAWVRELLKNEPRFYCEAEPLEFLRLYYANDYPLPSDRPDFALQELREMVKEVYPGRAKKLVQEVAELTLLSAPATFAKVRFALMDYLNQERESDFAKNLNSEAALNETMQYLEILTGMRSDRGFEIDDRPAYLEWAVWRAILAFGEYVGHAHQTRGFQIDQDFLPLSTAPGGGSDLLFEYEDFVLVVEVTLTESHRQMSAESEPVRRHTVNYQKEYPGKEVYCLFLAPSIDNNVAESFRIGVWYDGNAEAFVNIIPLSIREFLKVMEAFSRKRFNIAAFRNLLDRCLVFRNVRAPQWKACIAAEIVRFSEKYSS